MEDVRAGLRDPLVATATFDEARTSYVNLPASRAQGVEASFTATPVPLGRARRRVRVDRQPRDPRRRADGGRRAAARRAAAQGHVHRPAVDAGPVAAGATLTYVGERRPDSDFFSEVFGVEALASYRRWDAYARVRLGDRISVSVVGENLTDERYEDWAGFPRWAASSARACRWASRSLRRRTARTPGGPVGRRAEATDDDWRAGGFAGEDWMLERLWLIGVLAAAVSLAACQETPLEPSDVTPRPDPLVLSAAPEPLYAVESTGVTFVADGEVREYAYRVSFDLVLRAPPRQRDRRHADLRQHRAAAVADRHPGRPRRRRRPRDLSVRVAVGRRAARGGRRNGAGVRRLVYGCPTGGGEVLIAVSLDFVDDNGTPFSQVRQVPVEPLPEP